MTPDPALYRLMTWLSPAFPVGAFSYSHGLETAIAQELITNTQETQDWLTGLLAHGSGHADAVFCARAHEAAASEDWAALSQVAEYAAAFQPTSEIRMESLNQGAAFIKAAHAAWPCTALQNVKNEQYLTYPVAVGSAAAGHGIDRDATLHAYLHAFISNLVSAAIRMVPLGQSDGQKVIAELEETIVQAAARAGATALEQVATATLMSDIISMHHETQTTRIFRS